MPKSSRCSWTPSCLQRAQHRPVASASSMMTLSVISSRRPLGSRPVVAQHSARPRSTRSGWRELPRREVDAHRRGAVGPGSWRCHWRTLPAGLAQHPAAERHDEAGLLRHRDELRGRDACPRCGCCQRTSASKPPTRPVSRRRSAGSSTRNSSRSRRGAGRSRARSRLTACACIALVEHLVARLAERLGAVHGDVGVAQERPRAARSRRARARCRCWR